MREKEYKNAFEKVVMKDSSKIAVRNNIEQQTELKKTKKYTALKWAVATAAAAAIICCVPQARSGVYAAVDYVRQIFTFADGTQVEIMENDHETVGCVEDTVLDQDYVFEMDGCVYFKLGDEQKDITEEIAQNGYFRYEYVAEDGNISVILIVEDDDGYGWAELLFDAEGNYITNRISVNVSESERNDVLDKAMHEEGVHTGNPYYDFGGR